MGVLEGEIKKLRYWLSIAVVYFGGVVLVIFKKWSKGRIFDLNTI